MATEKMKRKTAKRIQKRMPCPGKITNLDLTYCANRVRFDWLGHKFLVDSHNMGVEMDVNGRWCYTNQAMLIEKILGYKGP